MDQASHQFGKHCEVDVPAIEDARVSGQSR
jgi:hypothetical protein